jgi:hypothetical protein
MATIEDKQLLIMDATKDGVIKFALVVILILRNLLPLKTLPNSALETHSS